MRGTIHLIVQSAHLKYEMDFLRNITILKGDSATGKTTLVDMIQEYNLNGSDTGINLSCICPCRVIAGNTWIEQLRDIHGSLIFIDEGSRFVSSEDFARTIHDTDNYYVIVTRESLSNLLYSVYRNIWYPQFRQICFPRAGISSNVSDLWGLSADEGNERYKTPCGRF